MEIGTRMAESRSSSYSGGFEQWYINACRRHAVLPNKALAEAFFKADVKKSGNQLCSLVIFLDDLKDIDFIPLLEIFMQIDNSEIDAVDILNVLSCDLNWEFVLLLLRAMSRKLRVVDLRELSFGKEFLRDLFERGLTSQVLNLKSSHLRKLNMVGNFKQLHILNLDFSTSLTSFEEDCFTCMPNLNCLSLCETRIANLWTTSSALSKLPSLVELRFQVCLYCDNQEPASSGEKMADPGCLNSDHYYKTLPFEQIYDRGLEVDRAHINDYIGVEDLPDDSEVNVSSNYRELTFLEAFSDSDTTGWNGLTDLQNEINGGMLMMPNDDQSPTSSEFKHISDVPNKYISYYPSPICYERLYREYMVASLPSLKFFDHLPISLADKEKVGIAFSENFEYLPYKRKNKENVTSILQKRDLTCSIYFHINGGMLMMPNDDQSPTSSEFKHISDVPNKYISYYPSPICYERLYREYMVASLPSLKFLDHLPISLADKEKAGIAFSENFEYLPYKRKNKENVTSILQKREISACHTRSKNWRRNPLHEPTKSQLFYSRSLSAAKVGSSAWPLLHPISISGSISGFGSRSFRARQFEYHPSDSSLMAFGTLDGEVVVINHENEKIVSYIPSLGAMNCVLGLCWLKKNPCKLIAGSDNGSLKLFDIKQTSGAHSVTFDDFDQLTSVHVNSTDELFLASGYSKDVALYDICSGRRLQVFTDMHREHINVVKFANHSPSIFATSSFDQDVKMWDLRQKPISPCYTVPSSRGNVMACFSPDDQYLLVSAVDNEVKQLLAADGRLHLKFNIGRTGSSQNYTRSYYMNGRDYIISGSCDENVVRICCTQTGRRLRDISLEGKGDGASMFVQSLRGDPFRDFNMSILAAYIRPSSNSEIVKVNLLASNDSAKDCLDDEHLHSSHRMGG